MTTITRCVFLLAVATSQVSVAAQERGESGRLLPGLQLMPEERPANSPPPVADEPANTLPDIHNAPLFPDRGGVVYAAPEGTERNDGNGGLLAALLRPGLVVLAAAAVLLAILAYFARRRAPESET
jgi:hypothetical protein